MNEFRLDSESYRLETRTDIAGRSLICRYAGIRAIDIQYRYNSTVGFLPVQISSRSWQYRYYSSKLQQSKIIQYSCRILVILNSGAEIIIVTIRQVTVDGIIVQ